MQGHGEVIDTLSRLSGGERYESDGRKRWTSRYTKWELSSYAEYGLTGRLTLIGEAAYSREKTNYYSEEPEDWGFSRVKAGARLSLGTWQDTLFSLQPLIALHLTRAPDDPAATKSGDIDTELGLVLARNETLYGLDIFSVQEIAYRYRDRSRPDEVRADVTFGLKPAPGTMLLAKSLNTGALKQTPDGELFRSSKLSLSVVQALPEDWLPGMSVEAGAEQTVFGRSTLDGTTYRIAVWYRF